MKSMSRRSKGGCSTYWGVEGDFFHSSPVNSRLLDSSTSQLLRRPTCGNTINK